MDLKAALMSDRGTGWRPLVWTDQPLSFWGGFDPVSGRVVDVHHPLSGRTLTGAILAMPAGRGSSTGSVVLLEALLLGTAPAGLIWSQLDAVLAVGVLVADEMFERTLPWAVVDPQDFPVLARCAEIALDPTGWVRTGRSAEEA